MFNGFRIVELSHSLLPGEEEYTLQVTNRFVEELLPYYQGLRPPGTDYIMSEVFLWSHVGTHMEAPLHYFRDGADTADIALSRVVGDASLMTFTDRGVGDPIDAGDLDERGGHVREGDIVFIRTDHGHYRTSQSRDRPYLTEDATSWLVDRRIALLGVDCSGVEKRGEAHQPNHVKLFENGIPLIEHLANLDQLSRPRFYAVAVPWRVRGLEASPVSVVAFEEV